MTPKDLIQALKKSAGLKITCPSCEESFSTKKANLFTEDSLTPGAIAFQKEMLEEIESLKKQLLELKTTKLERVQRGTRSSNLGKILERFVPILPGFKYRAEESVPLLDPIDYISFNGLAKANIESLTFMDVKSGDGRLGNQQKSAREAIEDGNVSLEFIEAKKP